MIGKLYKIVLIVVLSIATFVFVKWYFFSDENLERFELEQTAIQVESIKEIAELATITCEDEVVVDTVEYYKSGLEAANGMIESTLANGISSATPGVKRRITLTTQGKIIYGFNLQDSKFKVELNEDTLLIHLPNPKILDIIQNPSGNEIFIEEGSWSDNEIKRIYAISRNKLTNNFKQKDLQTEAKSRVEELFKNLLINKKVVFVYE